MVLVSLTSLAGGCLSQVVPEHAPATTDDTVVLAMLRQRDFEGDGFVRINRTPFVSTLEPDRLVTMFVSWDAAAAYQAVSPDQEAGGGEAFPVGGVIVRAASDLSGKPVALTLMVKHEPGYFPEGGDFLFGVTSLDGTPASDAHGRLWGKVAECASCHEPRAQAGFLFGVAAADR
jgi:hypothetical protein